MGHGNSHVIHCDVGNIVCCFISPKEKAVGEAVSAIFLDNPQTHENMAHINNNNNNNNNNTYV